ncbi:GNAT family N-acetyltransferase, partial [Streptosporangium nondiastaticum]
MTDETTAKPHRPPHWRRDMVELAALFTAVTAADTMADTVVHGPDGPVLLASSAAALLATTAFHTWWARRGRSRTPSPAQAGAAPAAPR